MEARSAVTGEVVHRDSLGAGVAALACGDLRGTGELELIAVSSAGEVRGGLQVSRRWGASPALGCTGGQASMRQLAPVRAGKAQERSAAGG